MVSSVSENNNSNLLVHQGLVSQSIKTYQGMAQIIKNFLEGSDPIENSFSPHATMEMSKKSKNQSPDILTNTGMVANVFKEHLNFLKESENSRVNNIVFDINNSQVTLTLETKKPHRIRPSTLALKTFTFDVASNPDNTFTINKVNCIEGKQKTDSKIPENFSSNLKSLQNLFEYQQGFCCNSGKLAAFGESFTREGELHLTVNGEVTLNEKGKRKIKNLYKDAAKNRPQSDMRFSKISYSPTTHGGTYTFQYIQPVQEEDSPEDLQFAVHEGKTKFHYSHRHPERIKKLKSISTKTLIAQEQKQEAAEVS